MIYSKIEEAVFYKDVAKINKALSNPLLTPKDFWKAYKVARARKYDEVLKIMEDWRKNRKKS